MIFKNKLTDAMTEVKGKTAHITRLKRRTQDFEGSVFVTEQECFARIEKQTTEIKSMNKEVVALMDSNGVLYAEIEELRELLETSKSEFKELEMIKNNILASIEVLTNKNQVYIKDLKKIHYELFELRDRMNKFREDLSLSPVAKDHGNVESTKNSAANQYTQTEDNEDMRSMMDANQHLRENLVDVESMRSSLLTSIEVPEVENKLYVVRQ